MPNSRIFKNIVQLIAVQCFISFPMFSQSIQFNLQKCINTFIPAEEEITYCVQNNKISYCKKNLPKLHTIYRVQSTDSIQLKIPNTMQNLDLKGYTILGDSIVVLLTYKNLGVFKLNKKIQKWNLKFNIECEYEKITICNNEIILWRAYNYHPNDIPTNESYQIAILGLSTKKIKLKQNFAPDGLLFTHFPGNTFSFGNTYFAYNHYYPYYIEIFKNFKSSPILKIIDSSTFNNTINKSKIKLDSVNALKNRSAKDLMSTFSKLDYLINRVTNTYFLNDSLIMVVKKDSSSGENYRTLDVYLIKDSTSYRVIKNYKHNQVNILEDSLYDGMSPLFFINTLEPIFYNNNDVITLDTWTPDWDMKIKINERRKRANTYFMKNTPTHSINLYKWEIK